ncbi:MAG: hypothetical protein NTV01_21525 [Bacteroidia bacterium]|nr:hypothetical protein [Bacteroidia bacterium]
MKKQQEEKSVKKISRKDALKKAGMYAAFTAAASIVLLTPKKAQADSPSGDNPPNPGWGSQNNTPPSGGERLSSPFTKPEPSSTPSGTKNSPWK